MKKLSYIIIDGQWGSTGKGLLAGYLAMKYHPDTAVCNFGPNAGHTVILNDGTEIMTQMLPSAIICPDTQFVLMGPGSIIDPLILAYEIHKYADYLKGKTILIHPSACVVTPQDKERENAILNRISSTCKGTGAAQTNKIMRIKGSIASQSVLREYSNIIVCEDPMEFTDVLTDANILQIESAQGLELGINSGGWYPYCTSRDINVHQVLSDCGIPYSIKPKVYVSMRTYPIRVGDAFGIDGKQIGTSGPVYPDQKEIQWEDLNIPPEKTTVTKKVRRVFTWSWTNFEKVITMLDPDSIFLNFVNYLDDLPSWHSPNTQKFIFDIEEKYRLMKYDNPYIIEWIGTGPRICDIKGYKR